MSNEITHDSEMLLEGPSQKERRSWKRPCKDKREGKRVLFLTAACLGKPKFQDCVFLEVAWIFFSINIFL